MFSETPITRRLYFLSTMSRSYHGKGWAGLVMPLTAVTIQNIADRLECAAEQFTLEVHQVCICSNTSPIPRKPTTYNVSAPRQMNSHRIIVSRI
jgi:hypothetical protein